MAWAPMPTTSRAASAILAHQDPSSASERPLCTSKPRHRVRAWREQVRLRVLADRGKVGDRADCIGDVAIDGGDSAAVLNGGFRRNCGSQLPFSAAQRLALGAADGTGMSAESQGVTDVIRNSRTP